MPKTMMLAISSILIGISFTKTGMSQSVNYGQCCGTNPGCSSTCEQVDANSDETEDPVPYQGCIPYTDPLSIYDHRNCTPGAEGLECGIFHYWYIGALVMNTDSVNCDLPVSENADIADMGGQACASGSDSCSHAILA
jgi:hypothetical protein